MNEKEKEKIKSRMNNLRKKYEKFQLAIAKEQGKLDRIIEIENVNNIGRCFKYHNSYGSYSDPWWLYMRIIGIEHKYYVVEQYQKDCNGKILIEAPYNKFGFDHNLFQGYVEITPDEFREAKDKMLDELESYDLVQENHHKKGDKGDQQ